MPSINYYGTGNFLSKSKKQNLLRDCNYLIHQNLENYPPSPSGQSFSGNFESHYDTFLPDRSKLSKHLSSSGNQQLVSYERVKSSLDCAMQSLGADSSAIDLNILKTLYKGGAAPLQNVKMLETIQPRESSFNFIGLKWAMLKNRKTDEEIDFVYLEATGIVEGNHPSNDEGKRYGYRILQSVDIPEYSSLSEHNIQRRKIDFYLLKLIETSNRNEIDLHLTTVQNPRFQNVAFSALKQANMIKSLIEENFVPDSFLYPRIPADKKPIKYTHCEQCKFPFKKFNMKYWCSSCGETVCSSCIGKGGGGGAAVILKFNSFFKDVYCAKCIFRPPFYKGENVSTSFQPSDKTENARNSIADIYPRRGEKRVLEEDQVEDVHSTRSTILDVYPRSTKQRVDEQPSKQSFVLLEEDMLLKLRNSEASTVNSSEGSLCSERLYRSASHGSVLPGDLAALHLHDRWSPSESLHLNVVKNLEESFDKWNPIDMKRLSEVSNANLFDNFNPFDMERLSTFTQ